MSPVTREKPSVVARDRGARHVFEEQTAPLKLLKIIVNSGERFGQTLNQLGELDG